MKLAEMFLECYINELYGEISSWIMESIQILPAKLSCCTKMGKFY